MICLFEDSHVSNFYPLSLLHHTSELLVGTRTLQQRAAEVFDDRELILYGRPEINRVHGMDAEMLSSHSGSILFLNSRLLPTASLRSQFPTDADWICREDDVVIAARLGTEHAHHLFTDDGAINFASVRDVDSVELFGVVLYSYLWDLLDDNAARIAEDAASLPESDLRSISSAVHLLNSPSVHIAEGVTLGPGVVLDATNGPVVLDAGCTIMANSVIEGPCYVGQSATIKIGSKIYHGNSFGPWSKIGGEVENSIVLGYSNKQHDGFLGHSYLGNWINLGANTTTSDLKNNYGEIRVTFPDRNVETGRLFLGSLIGDHTKTSINTKLNTGSVIGIFCNIFGSEFPPKRVQDFSWGGSAGMETFDIDKAIEMAERVMARRNVALTSPDLELIRQRYSER